MIALFDYIKRLTQSLPTGECREWNYHFESFTPPNNLIGLYGGVR